MNENKLSNNYKSSLRQTMYNFVPAWHGFDTAC